MEQTEWEEVLSRNLLAQLVTGRSTLLLFVVPWVGDASVYFAWLMNHVASSGTASSLCSAVPTKEEIRSSPRDSDHVKFYFVIL